MTTPAFKAIRHRTDDDAILLRHPFPQSLQTLLGVAILVTSCLVCGSCVCAKSVPTPVPSETTIDDSVRHALRWLASRQNPDGSWGTGTNRVTLTCLATLAFLSHDVTPASETLGATVKSALVLLLNTTTNENDVLTDPEQALLAWCLARGDSVTRVPQLGEAAIRQARYCMKTQPTPWHVIAAQGIRLSKIDPDLSSTMRSHLVANFPTNVPGKAYSAAWLLLRREEYGSLASEKTALRSLAPEKWAADEDALLLCLLCAHLSPWFSGEEQRLWYGCFYSRLAATQVRHSESGYWTPESLGIFNSRETSGMTSQDAAVYATAMVLDTFPPYRILPVYVPGETVPIHPLPSPTNSGSGIRIDVEGL